MKNTINFKIVWLIIIASILSLEITIAQGEEIVELHQVITTISTQETTSSRPKQTASRSANNEPMSRCGTAEWMEESLKNSAAAHAYQLKQRSIYKQISQSRNDCTNKVILPIAIHFQGIATPNRACLEALAQGQIQTLNEDFQAQNEEIATWTNEISNFFPGINNGATCLEFRIATKNHPTGYGLQDGQPAITINRTMGDNDSNWSGYINIFVRSLDNFLGYAPLGGDGDGDGVVIDIESFGKGAGCGAVVPTSPYNLGRTLTHEIGHYLLLNHIWGTGCDTDDNIQDTPPSNEPYYGCPNIGRATCGSTDLHMNYMDYTNDACLYMFTEMQGSVMERYVDLYLAEIVENASLVCEIEEPIDVADACIRFTTSPFSIACENGAVSIRIEEGKAPFTIKVKGPIQGQATTNVNAFRIEDFPLGNYHITLEDVNGCEATEQFTITSNCGQMTNGAVSTSRSAVDVGEELVVLGTQSSSHRHGQNDRLPCMSLPLDDPLPPNNTLPAALRKSRLWEVGRVITVKFLGGGTKKLRDRIVEGAREWEKYANIRFQFVESGDATIRISFMNAGNYSYIGKDAELIKQEDETMNFFFLDYETDRRIWAVILHEFGHALGLLHEHVHPENNIQWDKDAIYDYNANTPEEIIDNIYFNLPDKESVYFCEYDPESVMHYGIPNSFTVNNFSVPDNNLISEGDKRFIGKLYPFDSFRNSLDCGYCSDPSSCSDRQLRLLITGEGSVTVSSENSRSTECQSTCANSYDPNTSLKLKATPKPGHRFVGWAAGSCANSTNSQCAIILTDNTTLSAIFEPIPTTTTSQSLNIRVEGRGYVEVKTTNTTTTCNYNCTFINDNQLDFQLQAIPEEGYQFVNWTSDYCGGSTVPTCQFALSTSGLITAMFEPIAACITFAATSSAANCEEGKLYINITEGIPPFNLKLEGPVSGSATIVNNTPFSIQQLRTGAYTISIEDAAGCQTQQSVSIGDNCIRNNTSTSSSRSTTRITDELLIAEEKESLVNETPLTVGLVYPNPFRAHTVLPFTLEKTGEVQLSLFNSHGQQVYEKTHSLEAGTHQIKLGADLFQQTGLYMYQLQVEEQVVMGKMMRL